MDTEQVMTIEEAASYLKVARAAIYGAVHAGRLHMTTVLGKRVVYRAEVEAYQPRRYSGKRDTVRPPGVRGPGGRPRATTREDQ